MRKKLITKRVAIAATVLISIFAVCVLGLSYYAVTQFTFAGERIIYGKKLSELALEIRSELLKRPGIEQVSFKTDDNMTLAGILVTRPQARANLILCHGYKSTKEIMYAYVDLFPDWNILLFDFRAHGQSEGTITSIGCHEYKDVIAAKKFLTGNTQLAAKKLPLIILGISMGGASALKAAEIEPDLGDAIIVDSTFAELDQIMFRVFSMKSNLPSFPFYPVMRTMFQYIAHCDVASMNPTAYVRAIKQPILFIHSCNDLYITPENSILLYANTKNRKSRLWIAPHCRHGLLHSYHSKLYQKRVYSFIKNTCPSCLA